MARTNYPQGESLASSVLGVKGPGTLAEIDELIQGVYPLDRAAPPEAWGPSGIRMYRTELGASAVGGQNSFVVLYNGTPSASAGVPQDVQLIVTSLQIFSPAAPNSFGFSVVVDVAPFQPGAWLLWAGLAGSRGGDPADLRYPNRGQGTCLQGNDAAPTLIAVSADPTLYFATVHVGLGGSLLLPQLPWVLPPGWAVVVRTGSADPLAVNWEWVERPLFPGRG